MTFNMYSMNRLILSSIFLTLVLSSCGSGEKPAPKQAEKKEVELKSTAPEKLQIPTNPLTNKDRALYFTDIITKKKAVELMRVVNKEIKFNNTTYSNLEELKQTLKGVESNIIIEPLRAMQMGNTIITHSIYTSDKPYNALDIMTFDHGRIQEMTHFQTELVKENPLGNSTVYGGFTTENVNKTGLHINITQGLMGNIQTDDTAILPKFFNKDFTARSHYSSSDSLALRFINSSDNSVKYLNLKEIKGEGNFTLAESKAVVNGQKGTLFDIFRFDTNRISEHWDVFIAD